jgi:hypothetical protein
MRTFIVLTTVVLMVAVSAVAADAQTAELKPSSANAGMPSSPLMQAAVREVARLTSSPRANAASPAQTARDDNRGWVERHPVWTGAIAGAGAGAVIGAASCSKSCFPIGKSGAAIVGAGWGAGIGVLIGWATGAAD